MGARDRETVVEFRLDKDMAQALVFACNWALGDMADNEALLTTETRQQRDVVRKVMKRLKRGLAKYGVKVAR